MLLVQPAQRSVNDGHRSRLFQGNDTHISTVLQQAFILCIKKHSCIFYLATTCLSTCQREELDLWTDTVRLRLPQRNCPGKFEGADCIASYFADIVANWGSGRKRTEIWAPVWQDRSECSIKVNDCLLHFLLQLFFISYLLQFAFRQCCQLPITGLAQQMILLLDI